MCDVSYISGMSDTPSLPFWFTVASSMLTFMGGLLSGQVSEFFKGRREREAREEARHNTNFDRRSQFQREALLALQAKSITLAESYMVPLIYVQQSLREQGEDTSCVVTFPDEVMSKLFNARFDVEMFSSRVSDEATRDCAFRLMDLNPIQLQPKNLREVQESVSAYGDAVSKLMFRIGIVLRSLDDAEIAAES